MSRGQVLVVLVAVLGEGGRELLLGERARAASVGRAPAPGPHAQVKGSRAQLKVRLR